MWKLLIAVLAAVSLSLAASNAEIESFLKASYAHNPNIEVEKVSVGKRVKAQAGWEKIDLAITIKDESGSKVITNSFYGQAEFIAQQFFVRNKDKHHTVSDSELMKFAEEIVAKNPTVELRKSRVVNRYKMPNIAGLEAVQLEFDLAIKQGGAPKVVTSTEVWFAQKGVIIPEIIDINLGESLKYFVKGEVKPEHYAASHLLAGNPNATYKMIVFSDPLCPACHHYLPDLIRLATKYPQKIALYYYYKQVIPASLVVEKATVLALKEGKKDAVKKLYDSLLKPASQDELAVLDAFNKLFGTKYTLKDINQKEILEHINLDAKAASELLILSTPTLFINGKYDGNFKEFAKIKKEIDK